MESLFTISDVRAIPGRGRVVADAREKFGHLELSELRRAIRQKVVITCDTSRITADALDIAISESLIRQRNIFILIAGSGNDIRPGSTIYGG